MFRKLNESWSAVRWKMLIIFVFFSVTSMILVTSLSVALINVVIRRESAYIMEERINADVESDARLNPSLFGRVQECVASACWKSECLVDRPETRTVITKFPNDGAYRIRPKWLKSGSFAGVVVDHGRLEVRSLHEIQQAGCSAIILANTAIDGSFLGHLAKPAGLQVLNSEPVLLRSYRSTEGISGEVEANFVPGSARAVPVVVTALNWQTGQLEDWVVCQVRLNYSRTIEDLSRMGLRTASWVGPLGSLTLGLLLVYAIGLLLALRLSKRIVAVIDGLSHAALRIGKGDFSVVVSIPEDDQLGILASSFNEMTRDLKTLREQEKQSALLAWDLALAREVQQRLYPRTTAVLTGVSVWGANTPARMVSGDLYEFVPFSKSELGILCADVSGKGVSAALMMAHLQALVRGRLLALDETKARRSPSAFISALNRDLHDHFDNNRYATMFYGELDSRTNVLRYINAGHCPAILISEVGEATRLAEGDLPVGLFPETIYNEHRITLSSGSAIVIYTDGFTDALNSQGEEFGEERLLNYCKSFPKGANGETIGKYLFSKATEWAAGVEQFDDTTILVLAVE